MQLFHSYRGDVFASGGYWAYSGEYVAGIDAEGAWDITTGSSDIVVAVIDTGIVNPQGFGVGRVLQGYDFISAPGGDAS